MLLFNPFDLKYHMTTFCKGLYLGPLSHPYTHGRVKAFLTVRTGESIQDYDSIQDFEAQNPEFSHNPDNFSPVFNLPSKELSHLL